jgi:hypothetical protein
VCAEGHRSLCASLDIARAQVRGFLGSSVDIELVQERCLLGVYLDIVSAQGRRFFWVLPCGCV